MNMPISRQLISKGRGDDTPRDCRKKKRESKKAWKGFDGSVRLHFILPARVRSLARKDEETEK